jgi:Rrf2 family protein
MKVSSRGRYGLRAMLELARSFGGDPLLMSTLAERQGLSRKYLHALLTALKSHDLVQSVRGPGGGFVLSRPPGKITLSEVLQAVEGPLSLVDCVTDKKLCDRSSRCVARKVWQQLSGAIESVLDSVTLQELIDAEFRTCPPPAWKTPRGRSRGKTGGFANVGKIPARCVRAKAGTR